MTLRVVTCEVVVIQYIPNASTVGGDGAGTGSVSAKFANGPKSDDAIWLTQLPADSLELG